MAQPADNPTHLFRQPIHRTVVNIEVAKIRPEDGLGRLRDRSGHDDLKRSIQKFGVLTPITVRDAGDDDEFDYLLVKGQGRTLACHLLGFKTIPAVVLHRTSDNHEKVQQFLIENVARLKMRPMERALLIANARRDGEEASSIAEKFNVSTTTVRKLEAQMESLTAREISTLKKANLSISAHASIVKMVSSVERADVTETIVSSRVASFAVPVILRAIDWESLERLGDTWREERLALLAWICSYIGSSSPGEIRVRLETAAAELPSRFTHGECEATE